MSDYDPRAHALAMLRDHLERGLITDFIVVAVVDVPRDERVSSTLPEGSMIACYEGHRLTPWARDGLLMQGIAAGSSPRHVRPDDLDHLGHQLAAACVEGCVRR